MSFESLSNRTAAHSQRIQCCCVCIAVIFGVTHSSSAQAQLFGNVNLNPNRKTVDNALKVTGSERFAGNREVGDFIGSGQAQKGFIGATTGTGTESTVTTSAVTTLAEQVGPAVNTPRTRRSAGIYDERLRVGFHYQRTAQNTERGTSIQQPQRALEAIALDRGLNAVITPKTATVRLQGQVPSEEQKKLVELVALFEPGIDHVENELTVSQSPSR